MARTPKMAAWMAAWLVLGALPGRAAAPGDHVRPAEFHGVCLREAVAELFADRPEQAVVLPDVAAYPVTAAFQEISLPGAVDVIARSARVEVRRESGVYVFGRAARAAVPEAVAEIVRDGDQLALRLVNFPLPRAAALIGAQLAERLEVPDALADTRATLAWQGPRDRSAVIALARAVDASVVGEGEALRLEPAPERVQVDGNQDEVTLDLRRASLREAAAAVARILGVKLVLRAGVPETRVTLTARNIPAENALRLLARWADATSEDGVVLNLADGVATLGPPAQVAIAGDKINLDLVDIPLRHALRLLFHGTGQQFAVQPEVPDVPITLTVENAALLPTLRAVIALAARQHPGITYWKQKDLYIVGVRRG
ncbi:MAG: hypothetical protein HY320_02535 [Armatimonadetes bacterium]|nr:hypothetical protein [Armatimonadota bacterium]